MEESYESKPQGLTLEGDDNLWAIPRVQESQVVSFQGCPRPYTLPISWTVGPWEASVRLGHKTLTTLSSSERRLLSWTLSPLSKKESCGGLYERKQQ
jgi:hypothetical protein